MGRFEDIKKAASTVEGLHEILTILLVATILTIFEVVFFFNVIAPEVKHEIDMKLKKAAVNIGDALFGDRLSVVDSMIPKTAKTRVKKMIADTEISPDSIIDDNPLLDFINTLRDRERELINKTNTYTKVSGVLLIIILVAVIASIVFIIKRSGKINKHAIIAAVVTVGLLIVFQYTFYKFGKKYLYTGSYGQEEFLKLVIEKLEE